MIYFAKAATGPCIKIGTSETIADRQRALCVEHKTWVEIVAVMQGDRDVEQQLHERFAYLRLHGEWFSPHDDLIRFIAEHGGPWDGEGRQKTLFTVVGFPAWHDWLKAYADSLGMTVTGVMDYALREQAKRDKFPDPMPKRFGR